MPRMDQGIDLDEAPSAERQDEPTHRDRVVAALVAAGFRPVRSFRGEARYSDCAVIVTVRWEGDYAICDVRWEGPSKLTRATLAVRQEAVAAMRRAGFGAALASGLTIEVVPGGDPVGWVARLKAGTEQPRREPMAAE